MEKIFFALFTFITILAILATALYIDVPRIEAKKKEAHYFFLCIHWAVAGICWTFFYAITH